MANPIQNTHPTCPFEYKGSEIEDDLVDIKASSLNQLKNASLAAMGNAPQVKERVARFAPQLIFQAASFLLLSYFHTFAMIAHLNSPLLMYGVSASACLTTNALNEKLPDVSGAIGSITGATAQGFVQTAHHAHAVYKMSHEDRNLIGAYTYPQALIATM